MKLSRVLVLLLLFSAFSLHMLSPTLARYSSDYGGFDVAVVAKWDLKISLDGENSWENSELSNFDLFQNVDEIGPGTEGSNSFYISSGESDVAISYTVKIKAEALDLNYNLNDRKFIPLIFGSSEDSLVKIDDSGLCEVTSGILEIDHDGLITNKELITIYWRWDASHYTGLENISNYNNEVLNTIAERSDSIGEIEFIIEGTQIKPE